jgi:hypothetical protein
LDKKVVVAVFRVVYILLLSTLLCAQQSRWRVEPASSAKPYYFVKTGAYLNPENARKSLLSSEFPLFILRMKEYYSLLTPPMQNIGQARVKLRSIRNKHPDAYIITLYKATPASSAHELKPPASWSTSLMKEGITAYRKGVYEEALALFDRVLIEHPDDTDAQFWYAKTLYQLKFYKEAKELFAKLQKEAITPAQRAEISGYLAKISHKLSRNSFSGWIALGTGYDNNINLTTDKETTQYGPYLLQNDTHKTKSHFTTAELALTHRYTSKGFTLLNRFYSYNELMHTARGNDLNYLDLSSSLIKRYGNTTLLVPVGANILLMEGDTVSYNFYTNPALLYQATDKLQLRTRLLLNDNHTEFAKKRDYFLLGGGAGIRYRLARFTGDLSGAYQRYDAKESGRYDVSKDLGRTRLYLQYRLASALTLRVGSSYEREHYRDLDPVMGYKREDTKRYYQLSATGDISQKSRLTASWQYTRNHSNINTFSYSRQNYNLACQYRF